ncbi:hypothetical protein E4665_02245 [Sporolactobacillus shoreae]|uniref:Uncharacterized protein n=1 Tax=Sporolactobacillus shoreae TaxID=1465501 RepID=A0A4Z0GT93_9BACL|nr:hypothetical protein [Sporolactobacillus shoreae]TGA99793.1 hypothetical protein E4665_02245 [Sporolactobacillus shoreae]
MNQYFFYLNPLKKEKRHGSLIFFSTISASDPEQAAHHFCLDSGYEYNRTEKLSSKKFHIYCSETPEYHSFELSYTVIEETGRARTSAIPETLELPES